MVAMIELVLAVGADRNKTLMIGKEMVNADPGSRLVGFTTIRIASYESPSTTLYLIAE